MKHFHLCEVCGDGIPCEEPRVDGTNACQLMLDVALRGFPIVCPDCPIEPKADEDDGA